MLVPVVLVRVVLVPVVLVRVVLVPVVLVCVVLVRVVLVRLVLVRMVLVRLVLVRMVLVCVMLVCVMLVCVVLVRVMLVRVMLVRVMLVPLVLMRVMIAVDGFEGAFIEHGERTHGHTGSQRGFLHGGCGNAFSEQCHRLDQKAVRDTGHQTSGRVVDDDRQTTDPQHQVEGPGHRDGPGSRATNDLHERRLSDSLCKDQAHEPFRVRDVMGQVRHRNMPSSRSHDGLV